MKQILIKHKPDNLSKDEWEKTWNNMQYGLSVLHKTLQELKGSTTKVKPDDFAIPNHYALLAFEAGKRQAYQEVIDMLPEGSKNS